MKNFFINNGYWLTTLLAIIFFVIDFDWFNKSTFSNEYLTATAYLLIVFTPLLLGIYFRNKK